MQTSSPQHKHLRRLAMVFGRQPIFFVTTCTHGRRRLLANDSLSGLLLAEWRSAQERHGWSIGPYVIMPDHVHFFATPTDDASATLASFMGAWKEWTAKRLCRAGV